MPIVYRGAAYRNLLMDSHLQRDVRHSFKISFPAARFLTYESTLWPFFTYLTGTGYSSFLYRKPGSSNHHRLEQPSVFQMKCNEIGGWCPMSYDNVHRNLQTSDCLWCACSENRLTGSTASCRCSDIHRCHRFCFGLQHWLLQPAFPDILKPCDRFSSI